MDGKGICQAGHGRVWVAWASERAEVLLSRLENGWLNVKGVVKRAS